MLDILNVAHIGIRIGEKTRSIAFYETLGFQFIVDAGFDKGHPVIMEHASGVVVNLLGPGTAGAGKNILMDVEEKYAGYTHVALRVESLKAAEAYLAEQDITITGRFSFQDMRAVFIRDPDRNVIELDAYTGGNTNDFDGYTDHP